MPDHVGRLVAMKPRLGYQFTTNARILSSFAHFLTEGEEPFISREIVLAWAVTAASEPRIVRKLHTKHALPAGCMPRTHATRCHPAIHSIAYATEDRSRIGYRSGTLGSCWKQRSGYRLQVASPR